MASVNVTGRIADERALLSCDCGRAIVLYASEVETCTATMRRDGEVGELAVAEAGDRREG